MLDRLRQRKIVQWGFAYLAGAWVLLQVLGLLSDTYGWPPAVMRAMPIVLVTGLLAVLVVAWYHGERGYQRVSRDEMAILAIIAIAGIASTAAIIRSDGTEARSLDSASRDMQIRIAVLPFENRGQAADADMAEAISDEIRGKLSTLDRLEVISRMSSSDFRDGKRTPQEIARDLDVQYLLVGTVRSQPATGNQPARIRVSPELLHIASRKSQPVQRWQAPFDAELEDIFRVQSEIADQVAAELDIELGASDRAVLAERPTDNTAAYELYIKAVRVAGHSFQRGENFREAVRLAQQAVELDPDFARAWTSIASWAGLAQWFANRGDPDGEYFAISRDASRRALELSPTRDGPIARASFLLFGKADFAAAADEFQQAMHANPNDERVLVGLCTANQFRANWKAAAGFCARAATLDPRNQDALSRGATSYAADRDTARALQYIQRLRELALESGQSASIDPATSMEVRTHLLLGRADAARAVLSEASDASLLVLYPRAGWFFTPDQVRRAMARYVAEPYDIAADLPVTGLYYLGDTVGIRRVAPALRIEITRLIAELHPQSGSVGVRRMSLAMVHALEGNLKEAVAQGERAARELPLDADGINAAYVHGNLAWIHLLAGDTTRALDVLTPILEGRYLLSPAQMRLDPRFASLRNNPRYQRMVGR